MAVSEQVPYVSELVRLSGGGLEALVNPGRGGDVLALVHQETQTNVLWTSRRARHQVPQSGPLDQGLSSFYDEYPGGIQELFPNTAASTVVAGAELPFHGEACRIAWTPDPREARGTGDFVALKTALRRLPIVMRKELSLDSSGPSLTISSTVENVSEQPLPFSWAFHPAFGAPLVEGGCRVYLPGDEAEVHKDRFSALQRWEPGSVHKLPTIDATTYIDLRRDTDCGADLFYVRCSEGWFVARNEKTGLTIACTWDLELMPFLWFWEECHDAAGYPWWGLEHVVGIEPHSIAPARGLHEHVDAGEARWLAAGESKTAHLKVSVSFTDLASHPVGVDELGQPRLKGSE